MPIEDPTMITNVSKQHLYMLYMINLDARLLEIFQS